MRLSGSTGCVADWPLSEMLPAIRDVGYEAVELSWARVERELAEARDPVAAVRGLLEGHGLTLSSLNIADLTVVEQAELDQAVAVIRQQMALARRLGLAAVSLKGGDRRRQSLAMFTAGLEAVLAEADELDISLCLANACGSRIEQIEDLRRVFVEIDHPRLGVVNDTGQFHLAAVNPRDVIREFGDRMSLMRVGDRTGKRSVPLGRGETNVAAIMEHAGRIGYDGWLVVEPDVPEPDRWLAYLAHARCYLEAFL